MWPRDARNRISVPYITNSRFQEETGPRPLALGLTWIQDVT
ncbi:hypothetical protein J1605_010783, partial [Eschrichtius robustus]